MFSQTKETRSDRDEVMFTLSAGNCGDASEGRALLRQLGPLSEKQAVRFRVDMPHAYQNLLEDECAVYNTIFYPNK